MTARIYGRVRTDTYALGEKVDVRGVYLLHDKQWGTDCAGAPFLLTDGVPPNHSNSVRLKPEQAAELRDLLTVLLEDWNADVKP